MKNHITRILRENQTLWEAKLWQVLRNRQLAHWKFRRQYQIGKYVVDFCCLSKKLVIELDGGHHNIEQNKIKDEEKQKYIESQGYKALRFWNDEVDKNIEGVIDKILENCKK
ncbi:MAG: DUF559 domain-containing protein [Candidatus Magasanikbacteria bacterium]|nr:DUF559 domain-containing protein [Candidatus Magasanikbacteria bacterium]